VREDANVSLDAVIALAEPLESHALWRPRLREPADELAREAAVDVGATAVVTFDVRSLGASVDRFVASTVADALAAMNAAPLFAGRCKRAWSSARSTG
jgi:hypothetical protein